MSTNSRRVTLLFPKVNDTDDKRSNYRLMSVLCLQEKPYLLISANLQSNMPTCISLNVKFPFLQEISRVFHIS